MRSPAPIVGLAAAAVVAMAAARAGAATVDLYTVGPGAYTFAFFGHTALCVTDERTPEGRCYDFGVPTVEDPTEMAWGSIRGQRLFAPVIVPLSPFVATNEIQDRTVERQRLPLAPEEAERLVVRLDEAVRTRDAYAYHPAFANCTTVVRDVVDEAFARRLSQAMDAVADNAPQDSFRRVAEVGMSGRLMHLFAFALFVGPGAEEPARGFRGIFVPSRLRDAVRTHLGVEPETVYAKRGPTFPASALVGRGLCVALGLVLTALLFWARRKGAENLRTAVRDLGFFLGMLGLVVASAAAVVTYPEVRANWVLAIAVPLDFGLAWMRGDVRRRYLEIRLGVVGALALASLVGITRQPLVPAALLFGLPLLTTYWMLERAPKPARS